MGTGMGVLLQAGFGDGDQYKYCGAIETLLFLFLARPLSSFWLFSFAASTFLLLVLYSKERKRNRQ